MSRGTVIIAGSLAQRPGYGGHAWVFLQWLLGFRKLGWEVLFLDWLDATMCFDAAGGRCAVEDSWNLRYLADAMEQVGLGEAWSVNYNQGERTLGLSRSAVLEKARRADLLINVMGFLSDWEILALPRRRVLLDIDPGFGQMWQDLGLAMVFGGHDAYLTIGENIGQPDCTIPTCGLSWIATPQPIALDQWPMHGNGCRPAFTSIASWRGPFGPVEYRGKSYGLRVHEFRKFAELPRVSRQRFEVAMEMDPAEVKDIALLEQHRWQLLEPRSVAATLSSYREFIQHSMAELMIAKNMYVETRGGWFSDRSICYLASGRPVLAQETGFSRNYPSGEGLLAFSTLEEAVAGAETIASDYARHSRAARALAEEHFASDKVLTRLLEKLP
jgi:hypothetical protein